MERAHLYIAYHLAAQSMENIRDAYKTEFKDFVYAINDKERERATADWYAATSSTPEKLKESMTEHTIFRVQATMLVKEHFRYIVSKIGHEIIWPTEEERPFDVTSEDWASAIRDVKDWVE